MEGCEFLHSSRYNFTGWYQALAWVKIRMSFAYVGSGVGVSGVGNRLKVWGCNLRSRRRFNLVLAWWRVAKTRKDGLTEKDAVLTKLKDQREEAYFLCRLSDS